MFFRTAALMLFLAAFPMIAFAQLRTDSRTTNKRTSKIKTTVSVELLADAKANGLTAQQWGQTFEKIGYRVRIRRAILSEKPEIKERTLGRLREVRVIGKLDRSGRLIFADRTFLPSQGTKLAEWLRSLEVYGAQGSPTGKPVWGLEKTQFEILFNALSGKVNADIQGQSLSAAVAAMKLPADYPLRYTTAAREQLSALGTNRRPVRELLKGHSKGTALALALREYGLGFRPQRMPNGGLELAIESRGKVTDVWPIGWELKQQRSKTAPQFFKLVPVELEKVKLVDALDGISVVTDVPIHLDHFAIAAKGIDVDKIVISYPSKKTSWSLLLRSITTPYKLTRNFRIDESGRPFVWVTPFVPTRPAN
mgnify:CR=1 FL=1|jgi:hypothetical protein